MTRILIIAAHGQIARVATQLFLDRQDAGLTLHLRQSGRLKAPARHPRVRIVDGDALDGATVKSNQPGSTTWMPRRSASQASCLGWRTK